MESPFYPMPDQATGPHPCVESLSLDAGMGCQSQSSFNFLFSPFRVCVPPEQPASPLRQGLVALLFPKGTWFWLFFSLVCKIGKLERSCGAMPRMQEMKMGKSAGIRL